MSNRIGLVSLVALLMVGCGGPSTSSTPTSEAATPTAPEASTPTASSDPVSELPTGSEPLPAGRYTRAGFRPSITIELEDGWVTGTLSNGFFDVQQDAGTPDVIAVQFGLVQNVVGAGGSTVNATSAEAAAAAIAANPGLEVLGESESRISGLIGANLEVENSSESHTGILDVSLGRLGIDPGRRLWISLFDTDDGVLAVMVGGSVAQWDRALALAEPVLESVVIGAASE
jgi:hypothetical protein